VNIHIKKNSGESESYKIESIGGEKRIGYDGQYELEFKSVEFTEDNEEIFYNLTCCIPLLPPSDCGLEFEDDLISLESSSTMYLYEHMHVSNNNIKINKLTGVLFIKGYIEQSDDFGGSGYDFEISFTDVKIAKLIYTKIIEMKHFFIEL